MTTPHDRRRGALLGLAWGDVFGAPMEGWTPAAITAFFGDCHTLIPDWPPEARGLPPRQRKRLRPIGLHTDDTQQAIALLAIALTGWHPERWAATLLRGFEANAWRGFGRNFIAAVHQLRKGTPPGRAGSPSAGIGAAMRTGPLGALLTGDALRDAVYQSTLTTHADIRAAAIAHAVAWTVSQLIEARPLPDIRAALPAAVAAAEARWLAPDPDWTHDRAAGHQISHTLAALLTDPMPDAATLRQHISDHARPHLAAGRTAGFGPVEPVELVRGAASGVVDPRRYPASTAGLRLAAGAASGALGGSTWPHPAFTRAAPNQGFALLGGAHALLMSLRDDIDPQATLTEIVRQGDDTDTVAAIAGSLLGARFGTAWIPTDRLLDAPRLTAWADALATAAPPPETRGAFFAAEAAHTRAERQFQLDHLAERRTGA